MRTWPRDAVGTISPACRCGMRVVFKKKINISSNSIDQITISTQFRSFLKIICVQGKKKLSVKTTGYHHCVQCASDGSGEKYVCKKCSDQPALAKSYSIDKILQHSVSSTTVASTRAGDGFDARSHFKWKFPKMTIYIFTMYNRYNYVAISNNSILIIYRILAQTEKLSFL